MSATTIVDIGQIDAFRPSIGPATGDGGTPASGVVIGMTADLRDHNNLTNVLAGFGTSISGQFRLQVQTSDSDTSGNFTDPTSGLPVFPTNMLSGGILVINSGNNQASGGFFAGGFLRPHRYARVNILSGDQFNAQVVAGFLCQPKRTGSGAGYTYSPGSGTVGGF